jgi:hypothetical protein
LHFPLAAQALGALQRNLAGRFNAMSLDQAFLVRAVAMLPNLALTPEGFADLYRNCSVVLDDGTVGHVRVHKYRLNRAATGRIDTGHRIRDAAADAERELVGPLIRRWCGRNGSTGLSVRSILWTERKLNQVFMGKGSPRDIGFVLKVLKEVGRIDHLYPNHRELAAYQEYCDNYIGVDCSGLVNNYFIATGHFADTNGNCQTLIRNYGRLNRRLDFLPSRPQKFILVWQDMSHIAIIDRWERQSDRLQVVESSASMGGVSSTVYELDLDTPDITRPAARRYWRARRTARNNSVQKVFMVSPMPAA